MRQALARTYKKTQGLAISTILLAVVLLVAIAVTIAMSSRASNGNSSIQQAKLNASTLMNQASNMRIGYDRMQANGVDASIITLDTAANTGLFNPISGGTVQQFPPGAAYIGGTPGGWYLDQMVVLQGVGTGTAYSYVLFTTNLTEAVCQAINNLAYGASLTTPPPRTTTPEATAHNIETGAAMNFTGGDYAGATNHPEGCFLDNISSSYVYYKPLVEN